MTVDFWQIVNLEMSNMLRSQRWQYLPPLASPAESPSFWAASVDAFPWIHHLGGRNGLSWADYSKHHLCWPSYSMERKVSSCAKIDAATKCNISTLIPYSHHIYPRARITRGQEGGTSGWAWHSGAWSCTAGSSEAEHHSWGVQGLRTQAWVSAHKDSPLGPDSPTWDAKETRQGGGGSHHWRTNRVKAKHYTNPPILDRCSTEFTKYLWNVQHGESRYLCVSIRVTTQHKIL